MVTCRQFEGERGLTKMTKSTPYFTLAQVKKALGAKEVTTYFATTDDEVCNRPAYKVTLNSGATVHFATFDDLQSACK